MSNPTVEDAAGGEADKFLRLPREMPAQLNLHLIFHRGGAYFTGVYAQQTIPLVNDAWVQYGINVFGRIIGEYRLDMSSVAAWKKRG